MQGAARLGVLAFSPVLALLLTDLVSANISVDQDPWTGSGTSWFATLLVFAGSLALVCLCFLLVWFLIIPRITQKAKRKIFLFRLAASVVLIILLLLVAVSVFPLSNQGQPDLVFDSEDLNFEVLPNSAKYLMTGYYLVRNPTGKRITRALNVPLPRKDWTDTHVQAANLADAAVRKLRDGFVVTCRFEPYEEVRIDVRGCRRIEEDSDGKRILTYALTTTKKWGRPLRKAVLTIQLPRGSRSLKTYPEGGRVSNSITAGVEIWISKDGFMPERDLEIVFEPPQPDPSTG